jgi:hypothetical protein
MIIRELELRDLGPIDTFWQRDHKGVRGIPDRSGLLSEAVVENGKVLGYGHVKVFGEASMWLDQTASAFQRAKTFKLMMDKAIRDSKNLGLDLLHVGVEDPHFEMLLRGKYKFADRGTVLQLELKDGRS